VSPEVADVVDGGGLEVGHRADHVAVVGVGLGPDRLHDLLVQQLVRRVLHRLAALVLHHLDLVLEALLGEARQQVAHPIGLEPQAQLELVHRQRLEVVGAIEVGGAVDVGAAGRLDDGEVLVLGHVGRALEHHVLEEVREAAAPGSLVQAAHVVPDAHRHQGQAGVVVQQHRQAVVERVRLDGDGRGRQRGCRDRGGQRRQREGSCHGAGS
jgi:hypothetical protein